MNNNNNNTQLTATNAPVNTPSTLTQVTLPELSNLMVGLITANTAKDRDAVIHAALSGKVTRGTLAALKVHLNLATLTDFIQKSGRLPSLSNRLEETFGNMTSDVPHPVHLMVEDEDSDSSPNGVVNIYEIIAFLAANDKIDTEKTLPTQLMLVSQFISTIKLNTFVCISANLMRRNAMALNFIDGFNDLAIRVEGRDVLEELLGRNQTIVVTHPISTHKDYHIKFNVVASSDKSISWGKSFVQITARPSELKTTADEMNAKYGIVVNR